MNQNIIRNFTLDSKKKLLDYIKDEDLKIRAYLWFNKLVSLKYMKIHGYIDLDFKDSVSVLENISILEEIMPEVFEKDEMDIVLTEKDFKNENGIIKILDELSGEEFLNVELLGWIYQYYISDRKERVFKSIKGRVKVEKDEIAAVTQLFTPKWIVQYMVENTLGKIYYKQSGNEEFKESLKYYIEDNFLNLEKTNIEDIKIIDPAMGSGHILVYVFDLLYRIYELEGYEKSHIVENIISKNIYGLDIDVFSEKLTIFALYMKSREKDQDIFSKKIKFNTISFIDSGDLDFTKLDLKYKEDLDYLVEKFRDGKNLGSIIKIDREIDFDYLYENIKDEKILKFIKQGEILKDKYDVLLGNPPYMGHKNMNIDLSRYIKEEYPETKGDLFAVFMELDKRLLDKNGLMSMINQHSWMFLSSFKKYREYLYKNRTILSLLHLGPKVFDAADVGTIVQSVAFVMKKENIKEYKTEYHRLVKYDNSREKRDAFLARKDMFQGESERFLNITNYPLAYWIDEDFSLIFKENKKIGDLYISKQGMTTSDNKRFLRFWHEVDIDKIGFNMENAEMARASKKKWFPYNKGGIFRKWYGNKDIVLNYENDGEELVEYTSQLSQGAWVRIKSREYYFKEAVSWPYITSTDNFGARYIPSGSIFDVAGPSLFIEGEEKYYLMGLLTTKLSIEIMKIINPTMNFQVENVRSIPVIRDDLYREEIISIVKENINLSKQDYDMYEKSWDFKRHLLLNYSGTVENRLNQLKKDINHRFFRIKENEERLNEIFATIYGLQDKFSKNVDSFDITVSKVVDKKENKMNSYVITENEIIQSLVSYFLGCNFGRYKLDLFAKAKENILIFNEIDNENDILNRFKKFICNVFGEENFATNYNFIANIISSNIDKTNDEKIREYFFFKSGFYTEHNRRYQGTPIYFIFESGKKGGIKGVFYIHEFSNGDLDEIKDTHLPILYEKYKSELDMDIDIKLNEERIQELEYYIKILKAKKINIDLDDGIKYNYEIFQKIELGNKIEKILTRLN